MATTTKTRKGKGSGAKNKPRFRREYAPRRNSTGRSAGGIVLLVFGILLTIGGVIYLADVATVGALLPGMPAAVYIGPNEENVPLLPSNSKVTYFSPAPADVLTSIMRCSDWFPVRK